MKVVRMQVQCWRISCHGNIASTWVLCSVSSSLFQLNTSPEEEVSRHHSMKGRNWSVSCRSKSFVLLVQGSSSFSFLNGGRQRELWGSKIWSQFYVNHILLFSLSFSLSPSLVSYWSWSSLVVVYWPLFHTSESWQTSSSTTTVITNSKSQVDLVNWKDGMCLL